MSEHAHHHACLSPQHDVSRRQVLGSLAGGAAGLGLGRLLDPTVAAEVKKQQKQVLFIWLDGGISQLETWDPKPGTEFGGPFRSIPTKLPGVHFGELVPDTAAIADKLTLIRSMSTKDENHSSGVPRIQRGDPKNRGVTYPFLGSAVTKLLDGSDNGLPSYMHIKPGRGGYMWKDAGFLGPRYGALGLGDGKPPIHIRRPDSLTADRAAVRDRLRQQANKSFKTGRLDRFISAYDYSYEMARQLTRRQDLFDPSKLPAGDAQRYGTHPLGRHLLQARRLLEAGVQFVKVTSYHWDTHGDNFNMHRVMVPQVDRPFAALVNDLDDRGLLDHTLVVLMSEFGRTPKINSRLGRDHWPEAWSVMLAGLGLKPGLVAGKTTANGAFCDGAEYDIGHLFHTIFNCLGIDAKTTEYLNNGQPLPIAHDDMDVIAEVLK